MASLLEQLRGMTTVVSDSGDINSIEQFKPTDSTTNPSLIAAAAQMPAYPPIVDGVLQQARDRGWPLRLRPGRRNPRLQVRLPSPSASRSSPSSPAASPLRSMRASPTTRKSPSRQAREIIAQYEKAGVSRERVLIKLASTWEGIKAAEVLEKEGIHCNLTLLFGLHQAIACAEAKVTLISPFVGRILDWYKKDTGKDYSGADDPGVKSVTTIYNYYKKFGYKTVVMGASFRNIGEIIELAGCDLLTIAPKLLAELESSQVDLPRKLDPAKAAAMDIEKITMDKATFDRMHAADRMAHDKLKEGIEGFSKALEDLEILLARRLSEISEKQTVGATRDLQAQG